MTARPRKGESAADRTQRGLEVLATLQERFPDARCELDFRDPFQLLCAVVLSAQSTDVKVNQVTPGLFARYPGCLEMARATAEDVERIAAECDAVIGTTSD
jgi:endonuclease-3